MFGVIEAEPIPRHVRSLVPAGSTASARMTYFWAGWTQSRPIVQGMVMMAPGQAE